MFAETTQIEWPATIQFIIGLAGVLTIVVGIFTVTLQAKKLFGRRPPLDEDIKTLRVTLENADEELHRRVDKVKEDMDERFRELALDRARSLGELHEKINGVNAGVQRILGRMEREES